MTPQDPNDDLTVSNSPAPINSPTATPPQPSATSGSPDNQAGAPQTPPQQPQQPQDASGAPNAATTTPNTSQPQGGLNNSPAAPVHPAVKKAGVVRAIAETLAGGPRTAYAIDPTTGAMTATQTPLSTRQIGLAIAMAALSGGISGLGEKGPGAEGRAAQDGFKATQQQAQQADQQAQQTASADYARQAAIANTNFQTHANALRLGQMEYEQHKQYVADAAPVLQNLQDAGAILESGVREGDLLSKYHVTKDMAVVDGIVPRMAEGGKQATNPDGSLAFDNTYSVIDPSKKIQLPDETAKLLADWRVPGYFTMKDGQSVPISFAGSSGIRAGLLVDGLATASALRITQASIDQQLKGLGKDADTQEQRFTANLKSSLADGSVTPKALKAFARYTGEPLDEALTSMQRDKVDPSLVGQIASLIPADAREQIKQARVDAAKYSVIDTEDKARAVIAAPGRFTSEQVSAARNFIQTAERESVTKATQEARARVQATGEDVQAMYRFGRNPVTGETLNLTNAAPSMLVDPATGEVIPQDLVATYKPTSQQRQTADTARQVLSISQGLQAQIAANPALIGPLAGRSKAGLAKLGLGDAQAQKLLDDVSLLQSAVTKMHTGARGSELLLKKSQGLINASQNPDQFTGALQSINEVSQRYADEDRLTTVADYRNRQQSRPTQPTQPKQVSIPAGAQIGRDANGTVVGYRLNNQYVPLNGGR